MSEFMSMSPQMQEYQAPHLQEAMNYFQNMQTPEMNQATAQTMDPTTMRARTMEAAQTENPNTPMSQRAATQMSSTVDKYGPELEKFLYGKMMGGGADTSHITSRMQEQHQNTQQDMLNKVKASGVPMQSSAMGRTMSQGLGNLNNDFAMQLGMFQDQMRQQDNARQMQGAQGLQQLPGFYAQPSSIEMAILQAQQPYNLTNLQNRQQSRMANMDAYNQAGAQNMQAQNQAGAQNMQAQNQTNMFNVDAQNNALLQNQSAMANWMAQLGMYQPERMQEPSQFDQYIAPFTNPLLQGFGQAMPFML